MSNLDQFAFTPDTTQYDPVNAYWLRSAARLAYSNSAVVQSTTAGWGFDCFRFFDRNDTQAYVAGNAQTIIVAFRGTEPRLLKDWLTDCDTCFCGGTFVHG